MHAAATARSLQSCPTLCDPTDGSLPGSPVPGILQARTLEWVAISFSSTWKWKVKVKSLSRVRLLVTPWTAAYQAPPSMGFSRQEYWKWGAILPDSFTPTSSFIIYFTAVTLGSSSWMLCYNLPFTSLCFQPLQVTTLQAVPPGLCGCDQALQSSIRLYWVQASCFREHHGGSVNCPLLHLD